MLSAIYLSLYAVFGFLGGNAFRILKKRTTMGFDARCWVLLIGITALALAFARFIIDRHGPFGKQPESILYIGTFLLVIGFLLGSRFYTKFTKRRG